MNTIFLSVGICVLGVAMTSLYIGAMARAVARKRIYAEEIARFSQKANALLDDDDTPQELLETISFLNQRITNKRSVIGVVAFLLNARKIDEETEHRVEKKVRDVELFFEKRPELERAFEEAFQSAIVAIFFNGSGFVGTFARWVYFRAAKLLEPTETVMELKAASDRRQAAHVHQNECAA